MSIALHGAKPVRSSAYPSWPQFDEAEEQGLLRSLHQGQWWRASGSEVKAFEQEFADFHGAFGAIAVTNGTHALEVALLASGVGIGDEVLVPALTFISTSMAVQRVGAVPVPVDVHPTTFCIEPDKIIDALTRRTKAIIPVHMSGHFCDMEAIGILADDYNLIVIQDAAHAHGAVGANGLRCGEWGSMACFSFQNFKLMTAGEGGLVLCPSQEAYESVFLHANCGRPEKDTAYMHTVCGSNYRMNEFSASVLRAQLKRLPQQTKHREEMSKYALDSLAKIPGITPQGREDYAEVDPHYMLMFTIDQDIYPEISRDHFVEALVAEGIPAFKAYRPIYRIPAFWAAAHAGHDEQYWIERCPNSDRIGLTGIWIHHRALLGTERDARDIARAVEHVLVHRNVLENKVA